MKRLAALLVAAAALTAAPAYADCLNPGRVNCRPLHGAAFIRCAESQDHGPNPFQLKSAEARQLGPAAYADARYGGWAAAETAWRRRCNTGQGWW